MMIRRLLAITACAMVVVFLFSGCSTVSSLTGSKTNDYEKGQQDARRAMQDLINSAPKGRSPYSEPYKYIWDKPITQKVIVPGAIRGGVFYPAHEETIIVVPPDVELESSRGKN